MEAWIDTASVTSSGRRQQNEDCAHVVEAGGVTCAVVADGLGGHRGGDVASRLAVDAAIASFCEAPDVSESRMADHIVRAHEALLERQRVRPQLLQMRSTIVMLLVSVEHASAVWGHVGDSRLYHVRDGRVAARTKDHSVSQALVNAGEIAERDQGHHVDRSRLLRVLGTPGDVRPTVSAVYRVQPNDAFLLCSDGFWESLREVEVAIDACATSRADEWLHRLERRVSHHADSVHDNFTAVAARVFTREGPATLDHEGAR